MIDSLRTPELEAFLDGLPGDRQQNMLRYEAILDRGGPDSALVHMVEASLRAPNDGSMPESDKTAAFARLFTTIHAATHESLDQVQAHTDRLWGRLSNDEKRQIALNPSAAATIAIDAMRNDPLLAARVTPTASDTPRGIEAYQGGAALGFMGGHFAALRGQDAARAAEARQFADLGISRTDAATFSSIGLDRVMFDRYMREGFSQSHITAAARDANTLGFRGREDVDIAMRAPTDLRSARAAIERARTDEERAAAQRRYDELVEHYQNLPDSDPRKQHALRFIQRASERLGEHRAHIGDPAARDLSDQVVGPTVQSVGTAEFARLQTERAAESAQRLATMTGQAQEDAALAALGLDVTPTSQTTALTSGMPDVAVTADAAPAEDVATRTADAGATPIAVAAPVEGGSVRTAETAPTNPAAAATADANPAGTTPAADNRTRVARAPARLPSATV